MSLADELHALKERSAKSTKAEYQKAFMRAVAIDLATQYVVKLGYQFELERIQRIADEALYAISEGMPANFAYWHAVRLEIDLYGDPNDKTWYVGLLGTSITEGIEG